MGKGAVIETHPLSAGTLGSLTGPGSLGRYTRELLAKADVVLLAGTRTNEDGTDSWRLIPPSAEVIHLDIDAQEIGRNYEPLRLAGEAATTLSALGQVMAGLDLSARTSARGGAEARIARAWQFFFSDRSVYADSKASPLRARPISARYKTGSPRIRSWPPTPAIRRTGCTGSFAPSLPACGCSRPRPGGPGLGRTAGHGRQAGPARSPRGR